MSKFRDYVVSDAAARMARSMNLAVAQVADMARRSAIITHDLGNRRYDDFIMRVEGGEILSIRSLQSIAQPKIEKTPEQKAEDKARVEAAIALHFPRHSEKT